MALQSGIRYWGTVGLFVICALLLAACPVSVPNAETAAIAPVAATAESTPELATATTETTKNGTNANAARTFQIVSQGTEARFSIDEVLMGQDKTVIGKTALVEGQITVDPANPSSATISPIRIDARDLTTDSSQRNGAIRRFILQSNQDAYQYIVFTPTAIAGLPTSVTIGQPFEFTVTGDLTIRDVTKPATFTMMVTANSATELVGLGQTTITRSDYNLTIPRVPSVANVAEEVPLEIEFTAVTG